MTVASGTDHSCLDRAMGSTTTCQRIKDALLCGGRELAAEAAGVALGELLERLRGRPRLPAEVLGEAAHVGDPTVLEVAHLLRREVDEPGPPEHLRDQGHARGRHREGRPADAPNRLRQKENALTTDVVDAGVLLERRAPQRLDAVVL